MVKETNGTPGEPQLFHTTITGGEVPYVTPLDIVAAEAADETHMAAIANSGDRRNLGYEQRPSSDIVTQDLGLDRKLLVPEPSPTAGPVFELSGVGSGRVSGHNRIITEAEKLRTMTSDDVAFQAEVNAAGRAIVDADIDARKAVLKQPKPTVGKVDPITGRAILGSLAREPIVEPNKEVSDTIIDTSSDIVREVMAAVRSKKLRH